MVTVNRHIAILQWVADHDKLMTAWLSHWVHTPQADSLHDQAWSLIQTRAAHGTKYSTFRLL